MGESDIIESTGMTTYLLEFSAYVKNLNFFLTVSFTLFIVRPYELRTEKYFRKFTEKLVVAQL